jgi:hypothetical protein
VSAQLHAQVYKDIRINTACQTFIRYREVSNLTSYLVQNVNNLARRQQFMLRYGDSDKAGLY